MMECLMFHKGKTEPIAFGCLGLQVKL